MWAGTSRVSGTGWDQHSFRSVSGKVAGHFSFFFIFVFSLFFFFPSFSWKNQRTAEETELDSVTY
jgi:hypothetical protein